MLRIAALSMAAWMGLLATATPGNAQVSVRVPFVQVETGGPGVYVRAPFVRVWVPNTRPPVYYVPGPGVQVVPQAPPPPVFVPANPAPLPAPSPAPANVPPAPVNQSEPTLPPPQQLVPGTSDVPPAPQALQVRYPTLSEFARSFQARPGQYDVTLINPVTQQPVQVRFALPDGAPRRVIVDRDEIEFRYSLRQFVRIQFTSSGVIVVNR